MKVLVHNRRYRTILTVVVIVCVVACLTALLMSALNNRSPDNGRKPDTKNSPAKNDKEQPTPGGEIPPGDGQEPPSGPDTPPAHNPPKTEGVCDGDAVVANGFSLALPAYVYVTALDVQNKTNPALMYQPGEYQIFKCYAGMANITQTPGVPGGWLDPKNPTKRR